ncbi:MAG: sugar kinase [Firmicutes bacterium]|nr:sugar kinase [Bacillota bacterium]
MPNGETPVVAAIGVPIVDMVGYLEEFPKRGGHSPGLALDVAPGGPVINLVAGVSRLGHPSILLGKMGKDPLGKFMYDALVGDGVMVPGEMLSNSPTGVVLVLYDHGGAGEMRSFSFREGSADSTLGPADIGPQMLKGVKALFIDGILALDEQLTQAGVAAARIAVAQGIRVFCDPNLRIPGDELPGPIRGRMNRLMELSHEVLLNEGEARILTECPADSGHGVEQVGALLRERIPSVERWVIKQGAKGCYVYSHGEGFTHRAFTVEVSDTSGAGDSFNAGWIAGFLEGTDQIQTARFASAVAALTVTGKGAWRSLPDRKQVEAFLEERR